MRTESTGGSSAKQKYWQDHLRAWEESGLTQAAYCEANSLALQSFGYWRRKFKPSGAKEPHLRFFPLTVMPAGDLATSDPSSRIKLMLQGRRFLIEVEEDFSSSTLQRLIATLEQI